jgi:hypothetical protein
VYPATSVAFTNGVSTTALNATAFTSGSQTLMVNQGSSTGSGTFTIANANPILRLSSDSPSCSSGTITITQSGTYTGRVTRLAEDTYGNTATFSGTPTVTVSVPNNAKGSVAGGSLTFGSGTAAETSAAFTYTASGKDTNGVTLTATATGYAPATCLIKQP